MVKRRPRHPFSAVSSEGFICIDPQRPVREHPRDSGVARVQWAVFMYADLILLQYLSAHLQLQLGKPTTKDDLLTFKPTEEWHQYSGAA